MINHPDHFVIYDRETRYCIHKLLICTFIEDLYNQNM